MMVPKEKRIRSEKHRRFIASLPCLITGMTDQTQCAHISDGRGSIALKSGDDMTVPLCWQEHARQHYVGEKNYWLPFGGIEKAKEVARKLWDKTGDLDACLEIMHDFKMM